MSSYYAQNILQADWDRHNAASALAAHERADREASDLVRGIPQSAERKALADQAYADFLNDGEISTETYEWADRLIAGQYLQAAE